MPNALAAITIFMTLFLVGTLIWWYLRPQDAPVVAYNDRLPEANYSYRTFAEACPFNRDQISLEGQSESWRQSMLSFGDVFHSASVRHIYFVHGTFAGNDPWGMIESIKTVYPNIKKPIAATIATMTKKHTDTLLKDTGNFTSDYVKIYGSALGGMIPCSAFTWSSGNHHIARLKGAVDLLFEISEAVPAAPSPADKLLLYGHSHAGQIFSLLVHLMDWNDLGKHLVDVAVSAGYDRQKIYDATRKVSEITLDFVTMGTPILYSWPDSGYYRLLHIINHRGPTHLAGSLRHILTTKDGDYIQQLAILGTDLLAGSTEERRLNRRLDEILGQGRNLKQWQDLVKIKMRVPPSGRTLLVNYRDDGAGVPNFYKTFFGHGIYTRYEAMLFNTKLVASQLYRVTG